jgi:hypothetical protein
MSDCLGQCITAISSREFWPINSSVYTTIGQFLCLSCPFLLGYSFYDADFFC